MKHYAEPGQRETLCGIALVPTYGFPYASDMYEDPPEYTHDPNQPIDCPACLLQALRGNASPTCARCGNANMRQQAADEFACGNCGIVWVISWEGDCQPGIWPPGQTTEAAAPTAKPTPQIQNQALWDPNVQFIRDRVHRMESAGLRWCFTCCSWEDDTDCRRDDHSRHCGHALKPLGMEMPQQYRLICTAKSDAMAVRLTEFAKRLP